MGAVVGIPRGLFYHKYYPLWKTFLEEVGVEIALSPETNRRILDRGLSCCVGEACLPLKAWFGHAEELKDRCDMLFVPRYTSVHQKEYICPKFGGLPDMARHSLKGLPKLLAPEVNRHDRADGGVRAAVEAGRALGVGAGDAKRAYEKAVGAYLAHRVGLACAAPDAGRNGRPVILLLGHRYTIGDRFLNMDIMRKLAALGVDTITLDNFDGRALRAAARPLEKPVFWSYGTEALGCAYLLMDHRRVDGVLNLTCFGCGVDSFVSYLFERRVRGCGIPFATVSLDEHTGQAGMETRLEAFTDTLRHWRAGVC